MKAFIHIDPIVAMVFIDNILTVTLPTEHNGLEPHQAIWECNRSNKIMGAMLTSNMDAYEAFNDNCRVGIDLRKMDIPTAMILSRRRNATNVVTDTRHLFAKPINREVGYADGVGWCLLVPLVRDITYAENEFRALCSNHYNGSQVTSQLFELGSAMGLYHSEMARISREVHLDFYGVRNV
jgi:hypothetical protein